MPLKDKSSRIMKAPMMLAENRLNPILYSVGSYKPTNNRLVKDMDIVYQLFDW